MTRLIFLNRYFYPDYSATSQLLSDVAFHLVGKGFDIHVIASRQLYGNPSALLPMEECVRGVQVHRVATTKFGRTGLIGRSLDYLSYYGSTLRTALRITRRGDVLIAKTDPPMLSAVAAYIARIKQAKLVNWLQDLYPEVARELGVPLLRGRLGRALTHFRDLSLRNAQANVPVGDRMAEYVKSRGVATERVHTIPNWSDDAITAVARGDNPLRSEWGLDGKFVVGYSGNLGRAHEYDTLLRAADLLKSDARFVFLFIGGGHQVQKLEREASSLGLTSSFCFRPYQDQSALKYSLSAADVHWISLRPELEGYIVPSKFYGVASAGRATIAVGDRNGEVSRLVERFRCGLHVQEGDSLGLAQTLRELADDLERTEALGALGRKMIDAHFSRTLGLARWVDLLERVAGESREISHSMQRNRTGNEHVVH